MLLNLRILFLYLSIAIIVKSSYVSVEKDDKAINISLTTNSSMVLADNSINIGKRAKREVFLLGVITGIFAAAVTTPVGVAISEYVRASAPDECAISIRYKRRLRSSSALNMNFKSDWDNNWNWEEISNSDSVDTTKEKVSGGRLKLIQNYPKGKFCVEGILYSCGSQLNHKNTERSVILDVATIRNAWFKKGNPRLLEVDWSRNCIWFSDMDYRSVRAIDIYPQAFTDCENSDENCISNHIEVF